MPDTSFTIDCSQKGANGCYSGPLPNPLFGDLYFSNCGGGVCKICVASMVVHGNVHQPPSGCEVRFTGDLTVYGTIDAEIVVEGVKLDNQSEGMGD